MLHPLPCPVGALRAKLLHILSATRVAAVYFQEQAIVLDKAGLLNEILIEGDELSREAIWKYIEQRVVGGMAQNFGGVEWVKIDKR